MSYAPDPYFDDLYLDDPFDLELPELDDDYAPGLDFYETDYGGADDGRPPPPPEPVVDVLGGLQATAGDFLSGIGTAFLDWLDLDGTEEPVEQDGAPADEGEPFDFLGPIGETITGWYNDATGYWETALDKATGFLEGAAGLASDVGEGVVDFFDDQRRADDEPEEEPDSAFDLWGGFTDAFRGIGETARDLWEGATETVEDMGETVGDFWDDLARFAEPEEEEQQQEDDAGFFDSIGRFLGFGERTEEPSIVDRVVNTVGGWIDTLGDAASDARDWITQRAEEFEAEVERVQEDLDVEPETGAEIVRIMNVYGLGAEAAQRVVDKRGDIEKTHPFVKTRLEAERYWALVEEGMTLVHPTTKEPMNRTQAEFRANRIMFPEQFKEASTKTVAAPPKERRTIAKKREVEEEERVIGGEDLLSIWRDEATSLDVQDSNRLTIMKCPPPQGDYRAKGISPTQLADTKRLLEARRATAHQRVQDMAERLLTPAYFIEEIEPLIQGLFDELMVMDCEYREARLLYERDNVLFHGRLSQEYEPCRQIRPPRLDVGLLLADEGGVPTVRLGRSEPPSAAWSQLDAFLATSGVPAFSAPAQPWEEQASYSNEYLAELKAELDQYRAAWNKANENLSAFATYEVEDRATLGNRVTEELENLARLQKRIADLGERSEGISRIRIEVCCIHAQIGYAELIVNRAEVAEEAIANAEDLHARQKQDLVRFNLLEPVNSDKLGMIVAGWFGNVENVEGVASGLTRGLASLRTMPAFVNPSCDSEHKVRALYRSLESFKAETGDQRADVRAARERFERAVMVASVGAQIVQAVAEILTTWGLTTAARQAGHLAARRSFSATYKTERAARSLKRAFRFREGMTLEQKYPMLAQARKVRRQLGPGELPGKASRYSARARVRAARARRDSGELLGRTSRRSGPRALLGVGKGAPPPSGLPSPQLRRQFLREAESRVFRARAEAWARLTGRGPIDWDAFMARLRSAEFKEFATKGEAARSLGYADVSASGEWIFGVPQRLRQMPLLGKSAVRHELFHAVQDLKTGLFTKGGSAMTRLGRGIAVEYSAHLWGGPLIGVPIVWAPTVGGVGYIYHSLSDDE